MPEGNPEGYAQPGNGLTDAIDQLLGVRKFAGTRNYGPESAPPPVQSAPPPVDDVTQVMNEVSPPQQSPQITSQPLPPVMGKSPTQRGIQAEAPRPSAPPLDVHAMGNLMSEQMPTPPMKPQQGGQAPQMNIRTGQAVPQRQDSNAILPLIMQLMSRIAPKPTQPLPGVNPNRKMAGQF